MSAQLKLEENTKYKYWDIHERGDDVGINVLYLFGVSIGVIILHRIVSSIAVYRLTQNWKYAVLQFFDALMIQCVWTNYILGTDEPSNAQRYLQVLEATLIGDILESGNRII